MLSSSIGWPAGYFENGLSYGEITLVPSGSMPWYESFHASRARNDSYAAAGTLATSKLPITETPVLYVFNPPACAPITERLGPPYRPSKIWPKRSIRKL